MDERMIQLIRAEAENLGLKHFRARLSYLLACSMISEESFRYTCARIVEEQKRIDAELEKGLAFLRRN
jgi:hypothetical protein